jgi:hypothetical protein
MHYLKYFQDFCLTLLLATDLLIYGNKAVYQQACWKKMVAIQMLAIMTS